jgi:hypothetical protein
MKTRITLVFTVFALTTLLSGCFYSGGYRPDYYGSRYYAPRPYVRVVPPPVVVRPRVYVNPPRYNYRPRYESRNRHNYGNRSGRRRW